MFNHDTISNDRIVKRMFFLAWKACGGTTGWGSLQNNPNANEDEVFAAIAGSTDYPVNHNNSTRMYADYVFGRMMKMGFKFDDDGNPTPMGSGNLSSDYQGWFCKYSSYEALHDAAVESLEAESVATNG